MENSQEDVNNHVYCIFNQCLQKFSKIIQNLQLIKQKLLKSSIFYYIVWLPIHLYLTFENQVGKIKFDELDFYSIWNCIFTAYRVSTYPSVLDFWKIKIEKLSSTNWIFASYTGIKNPVRRTWFFQHDFSKIKYRWIGHKTAS